MSDDILKIQYRDQGKWGTFPFKSSTVSDFIMEHGGINRVACRPMYAREEECIRGTIVKDEKVVLVYFKNGMILSEKHLDDSPLSRRLLYHGKKFRKEFRETWEENGERLVVSGLIYNTIGRDHINRTVYAIDDADFIFKSFRERFAILCNVFPTEDEPTNPTHIRVDNWRTLSTLVDGKKKFDQEFSQELINMFPYGYFLRAWHYRESDGCSELLVYPDWVSKVGGKNGKDSNYNGRKKFRK